MTDLAAAAADTDRCFGCGRSNPLGLRLEFTWVPGEASGLVCLGEEYESHPGTIHGGIVATVLDEVMARAVPCVPDQRTITLSLRVRYIEPMRSGRVYTARAAQQAAAGENVTVHGELGESEMIASAVGVFRVV